MSFRTSFLGVLDRLRYLTGPTGFDIRTSSVTRRIETWSGSSDGPEIGTGDVSADDLEIVPRPKVVEQGNGALIVAPITPASTTGGYTVDQLNPRDLDPGQRLVYVVNGPNGEHFYQLVEIDTSRPFKYTLHLAPLDRDPPI